MANAQVSGIEPYEKRQVRLGQTTNVTCSRSRVKASHCRGDSEEGANTVRKRRLIRGDQSDDVWVGAYQMLRNFTSLPWSWSRSGPSPGASGWPAVVACGTSTLS
jgi:hypothetical protein